MNKIAWVTPSLKTGLGRYTINIKESLLDICQLEIFVAEDGFIPERLSDFQTIIYNIGNSQDNLPVYLAMRQYPGIAVLHDRTYHHLFAYYYFNYLKRPDLYYEVLSSLYGDSVAQYAEKEIKAGRLIWETEDCLRYPMRELIYPHATAVIVHSKSYLQTISQEFSGKVSYLSFPLLQKKLTGGKFKRNKLNIPDKKVLLLSYGFMSKNRMVEEVIKVIGEIQQLRESVYYLVAGSIHDVYLDSIKYLIDKYKLHENVKICGFVSDEELYSYLQLSDICINLRRYNTEGASWSILEQMIYGKAVIASDNGFFSEFPDDVIVKVRNFEEIEYKLKDLISNRDIIRDYGEKARKYVIDNFKQEKFVEGFVSFIHNSAISRQKKKIILTLQKEILNSLNIINYRSIEARLIDDISHTLCEILREGYH